MVAVHREIGQVFIIGLQIPQDAGQSRGRLSIGLPDRQCDDVRRAAGGMLGNGEIVTLPAAVKQVGFGVPGKIVLLGKIPQVFWQFHVGYLSFSFELFISMILLSLSPFANRPPFAAPSCWGQGCNSGRL